MRYLDSRMDNLSLLRNLGLKPQANQFSSGDQTSKRCFVLSVLHISYVLVWGGGKRIHVFLASAGSSNHHDTSEERRRI